MVRHAIRFAALLLLASCAGQPAETAPSRGGTAAANVVGAGSSRAAVEGFLKAVKDTDLQAMSALWGNDKGLARTRIKRDELDKRLVVMQCLLNHDRWSFVEDGPRLSTGGRQDWVVSLTRRRATAKTTLTTVAGPGGRWFLENAELGPLREFCQ